MDRALVSRLIREAGDQGIGTLHLWGGEPFLFPDLMGIVAEGYRQRMDLLINTNCFWAKTEEFASERIRQLLVGKPEDKGLQLIVSADGLHQGFKATPLDQVANVINAALKLKDPSLRLLIYSLSLREDSTLDQLLSLLPPDIHPPAQAAFASGDSVTLASGNTSTLLVGVSGPLNLTAGRAKALSPALRASSPLTRREIYDSREGLFSNGALYVSVELDTFLDSHHVGEGLFPFGKIEHTSLEDVISEIQADPLARLTRGLPPRHLLFPFRKHFPAGALEKIIGESHSIYELFNRLYLCGPTGHDLSGKLSLARQHLLRRGLSSSDLSAALAVIRELGDLTDAEMLETMLLDTSRSPQERWEIAFVYKVLEGENKGYFGSLVTRPWTEFPVLFGGSPTPLTTYYIGNPPLAGLGREQVPDWLERYAY